MRDQLIAYILGSSNFSTQDLEELLANIFSPTLKEEIMITGTGFLAVAAREAATKAKTDAKEEARRVAEKLATQTAKILEKEKNARIEAENAKIEAENAKIEAENAKIFQARLIIIRGWYRNISEETLIDMADLSSRQVNQLIDACEKAKNAYRANPDMDFKDLMQVSTLKDDELKAVLELLKR